MIDTCKFHDDYEDFASYLGVDYEDYYQLIYSLPDEDDFQKSNILKSNEFNLSSKST